MARLEKSEILGRKVRKDDVPELGTPTWLLAEEAIRKGDVNQALDLVDYGRFEILQLHDSFVTLSEHVLTWIARNLGEERVEEYWRSLYASTNPLKFSAFHNLSVKERLQYFSELFRGHGSGPTRLGDFTITEDADKYVTTYAPCGTGGRMAKIGPVGVTQKPYPWSWGKAGVSYYCTHCCMLWELISIETIGYPIRIHENVDKVGESCIHILYKDPSLIPERYFTRLGKQKT